MVDEQNPMEQLTAEDIANIKTFAANTKTPCDICGYFKKQSSIPSNKEAPLKRECRDCINYTKKFGKSPSRK